MATGTPLDDVSYISLESYRKDGSPVRTPVWLAPLDGKLVLFTLKETYKVKRIRRNPRVRVAQCDVRGKILGQWHDGFCQVVEDRKREQRAYAALRRKYGLLMRLGDVGSFLTGRMKRRIVLEVALEG